MEAHLEMAASLVAGLADGAMLLDRSLRCVAQNRAALEILGVRARGFRARLEAAGSPFALFGVADGEKLAVQCLEEGKPMSLLEVPFSVPGGESGTANVTFIPIVAPGSDDVVGLVFALRDVSAESRMQQHYTDLLARERARAAELERQVEERTRELRIALQEVTRLARVDPLTGALNRRAFTEIAEEALAVAKRHDRSLGLLLCDLDHFKEVNDTYGHQAGDLVLSATVRALTASLRRTDKVGRFGGEEFVVLLSETSGERILEIGDRCRESIQRLPLTELVAGAEGRQTASFGCAFYPAHGDSLDEIVAAADRALYHAKERGRNRVELYSLQLKGAQPRRARADASRVLVVHPDETAARGYCASLASRYQTLVERSAAAATARFRSEWFDVFVVKDALEESSGIQLLRDSLSYHPNAVRVLLTDTEDFRLAVEGTSLAQVDHILLEEKATGESLIRSIEDSLQWRQVARRRLLSEGPGSIRPGPRVDIPDLDDVIERQLLGFVFQPIVEVASGEVIGYEALCRPTSASFATPRLLVDAAVASGKIWQLSRLMRRIIAKRLEALPSDASVFINLHPADLDDPALLDGESFLLSWKGRVIFEITERSWIPDFRRCKESIARLRQLGFSIAVDDLGSGYASLNSVALLEPGFVKIDMTLIHGIEQHPHQEKLVRRIVEFARDAGIQVVAEGVETREQAEKVAEIGCHLMQGYYVGEPRAGFAARGRRG